jgi:hypothetical protein
VSRPPRDVADQRLARWSAIQELAHGRDVVEVGEQRTAGGIGGTRNRVMPSARAMNAGALCRARRSSIVIDDMPL